MPRWTLQDLKEHERRVADRAARLRAAVPEPDTRGALERAAPGEAACGCGPDSRYRVTFVVYRVRPLDWDNSFTKPLQDCLVAAGLLPDDNWRVLEGAVRSCKAASKRDERTEIVIERL